MSIKMIPAVAHNPPPALVAPIAWNDKLSREAVFKLAHEPNGVGAVIIALQDGRIDVDTAVEAINHVQTDMPRSFKRVVVAVLNAIIPG